VPRRRPHRALPRDRQRPLMRPSAGSDGRETRTLIGVAFPAFDLFAGE